MSKSMIIYGSIATALLIKNFSLLLAYIKDFKKNDSK